MLPNITAQPQVVFHINPYAFT